VARVREAVAQVAKVKDKGSLKRTTVELREDDQHNLARLSEIQGGISDVEAIRRSLGLARELLEWSKIEGGEVILQKGKHREKIRFL
jgi:hypothetical protein